jgi:copper chaperone CopZ
MKMLTLFLSAFHFISAIWIAQAKKPVQNCYIQTPTINCEDCKKRIEDDLKRCDVGTEIVVDYKRKTAKVTFITDRTNIEYI